MPFPAYAQAVFPQAGQIISLSSAFTPTIVRGIRIYPDNPLKFDFIVDGGDADLKGDELKSESEKLIRYFLASLTLPENDLWVNLSPYEKDRIVPAELGTTEMGIDMLAQDYLLKQITASLTNPDSDLGKEFWQKIYKQSYEKFGTTNVPVDTFNKVWIMPDKAEVYVQEDKAFVVESRLKVMLESDYLAREKSKEDRREKIEDGKNNDKTTANKSPDSLDSKTLPSSIVHSPSSDISSSIVREVFIPVLEKEVNEGKNFAQLRQIYNSIILSYWYKTNLKNSILNKVYADKRKVKGLEVVNSEKYLVSSQKSNEESLENGEEKHQIPDTRYPSQVQSNSLPDTIHSSPDTVQIIYQQYLQTFKKGVCNMMKVEYDPYTKKNIPRKYFAGGVVWDVAPILGYFSTIIGPMPQWVLTSTLEDPLMMIEFNSVPVTEEVFNSEKVRAQGVAQGSSEPITISSSLRPLSDETKAQLGKLLNEYVKWGGTTVVGKTGFFAFLKAKWGCDDQVLSEILGVKRKFAKSLVEARQAGGISVRNIYAFVERFGFTGNDETIFFGLAKPKKDVKFLSENMFNLFVEIKVAMPKVLYLGIPDNSPKEDQGFFVPNPNGSGDTYVPLIRRVSFASSNITGENDLPLSPLTGKPDLRSRKGDPDTLEQKMDALKKAIQGGYPYGIRYGVNRLLAAAINSQANPSQRIQALEFLAQLQLPQKFIDQFLFEKSKGDKERWLAQVAGDREANPRLRELCIQVLAVLSQQLGSRWNYDLLEEVITRDKKRDISGLPLASTGKPNLHHRTGPHSTLRQLIADLPRPGKTPGGIRHTVNGLLSIAINTENSSDRILALQTIAELKIDQKYIDQFLFEKSKGDKERWLVEVAEDLQAEPHLRALSIQTLWVLARQFGSPWAYNLLEDLAHPKAAGANAPQEVQEALDSYAGYLNFITDADLVMTDRILPSALIYHIFGENIIEMFMAWGKVVDPQLPAAARQENVQRLIAIARGEGVEYQGTDFQAEAHSILLQMSTTTKRALHPKFRYMAQKYIDKAPPKPLMTILRNPDPKKQETSSSLVQKLQAELEAFKEVDFSAQAQELKSHYKSFLPRKRPEDRKKLQQEIESFLGALRDLLSQHPLLARSMRLARYDVLGRVQRVSDWLSSHAPSPPASTRDRLSLEADLNKAIRILSILQNSAYGLMDLKVLPQPGQEKIFYLEVFSDAVILASLENQKDWKPEYKACFREFQKIIGSEAVVEAFALGRRDYAVCLLQILISWQDYRRIMEDLIERIPAESLGRAFVRDTQSFLGAVRKMDLAIKESGEAIYVDRYPLTIDRFLQRFPDLASVFGESCGQNFGSFVNSIETLAERESRDKHLEAHLDALERLFVRVFPQVKDRQRAVREHFLNLVNLSRQAVRSDQAFWGLVELIGADALREDFFSDDNRVLEHLNIILPAWSGLVSALSDPSRDLAKPTIAFLAAWVENAKMPVSNGKKVSSSSLESILRDELSAFRATDLAVRAKRLKARYQKMAKKIEGKEYPDAKEAVLIEKYGKKLLKDMRTFFKDKTLLCSTVEQAAILPELAVFNPMTDFLAGFLQVKIKMKSPQDVIAVQRGAIVQVEKVLSALQNGHYAQENIKETKAKSTGEIIQYVDLFGLGMRGKKMNSFVVEKSGFKKFSEGFQIKPELISLLQGLRHLHEENPGLYLELEKAALDPAYQIPETMQNSAHAQTVGLFDKDGAMKPLARITLVETFNGPEMRKQWAENIRIRETGQVTISFDRNGKVLSVSQGDMGQKRPASIGNEYVLLNVDVTSRGNELYLVESSFKSLPYVVRRSLMWLASGGLWIREDIPCDLDPETAALSPERIRETFLHQPKPKSLSAYFVSQKEAIRRAYAAYLEDKKPKTAKDFATFEELYAHVNAVLFYEGMYFERRGLEYFEEYFHEVSAQIKEFEDLFSGNIDLEKLSAFELFMKTLGLADLKSRSDRYYYQARDYYSRILYGKHFWEMYADQKESLSEAQKSIVRISIDFFPGRYDEEWDAWQQRFQAELNRRKTQGPKFALEVIAGLKSKGINLQEFGMSRLIDQVLGLGGERLAPSVYADEQSVQDGTDYYLTDQILERLDLKASDVFYDLGSGHGRVIFWTAFSTAIGKAVGIEYVSEWANRASDLALKHNISDRAVFINSKVQNVDFSDGTVFFLYNPFQASTLARVTEKLQAIARQKKIRVISVGGCNEHFLLQGTWLKVAEMIKGSRDESAIIFESTIDSPSAAAGPAGDQPSVGNLPPDVKNAMYFILDSDGVILRIPEIDKEHVAFVYAMMKKEITDPQGFVPSEVDMQEGRQFKEKYPGHTTKVILRELLTSSFADRFKGLDTEELVSKFDQIYRDRKNAEVDEILNLPLEEAEKRLLMPGVKKFLQDKVNQGAVLRVLSGGRESEKRRIFEKLGLMGFFQDVQFAGTREKKIEIFEDMIANIDHKENIVIVDDSLENIDEYRNVISQGQKRSGKSFLIGLANKEQEDRMKPHADYVIEDLSGLVASSASKLGDEGKAGEGSAASTKNLKRIENVHDWLVTPERVKEVTRRAVALGWKEVSKKTADDILDKLRTYGNRYPLDKYSTERDPGKTVMINWCVDQAVRKQRDLFFTQEGLIFLVADLMDKSKDLARRFLIDLGNLDDAKFNKILENELRPKAMSHSNFAPERIDAVVHWLARPDKEFFPVKKKMIDSLLKAGMEELAQISYKSLYLPDRQLGEIQLNDDQYWILSQMNFKVLLLDLIYQDPVAAQALLDPLLASMDSEKEILSAKSYINFGIKQIAGIQGVVEEYVRDYFVTVDGSAKETSSYSVRIAGIMRSYILEAWEKLAEDHLDVSTTAYTKKKNLVVNLSGEDLERCITAINTFLRMHFEDKLFSFSLDEGDLSISVLDQLEEDAGSNPQAQELRDLGIPPDVGAQAKEKEGIFSPVGEQPSAGGKAVHLEDRAVLQGDLPISDAERASLTFIRTVLERERWPKRNDIFLRDAGTIFEGLLQGAAAVLFKRLLVELLGNAWDYGAIDSPDRSVPWVVDLYQNAQSQYFLKVMIFQDHISKDDLMSLLSHQGLSARDILQEQSVIGKGLAKKGHGAFESFALLSKKGIPLTLEYSREGKGLKTVLWAGISSQAGQAKGQPTLGYGQDYLQTTKTQAGLPNPNEQGDQLQAGKGSSASPIFQKTHKADLYQKAKKLLDEIFPQILEDFTKDPGKKGFEGPDGLIAFIRQELEKRLGEKLSDPLLGQLLGFDSKTLRAKLNSVEGLSPLQDIKIQKLVDRYPSLKDEEARLRAINQEVSFEQAKMVLKRIFKTALREYVEVKEGTTFWGPEGFALFLKKKLESELGVKEITKGFFGNLLGFSANRLEERGAQSLLPKNQAQLMDEHDLDDVEREYLSEICGGKEIEVVFQPEPDFPRVARRTLKAYRKQGGTRLSGSDGYFRYLFDRVGMKGVKKIGYDFNGAVSKQAVWSWLSGHTPSKVLLEKVVYEAFATLTPLFKKSMLKSLLELRTMEIEAAKSAMPHSEHTDEIEGSSDPAGERADLANKASKDERFIFTDIIAEGWIVNTQYYNKIVEYANQRLKYLLSQTENAQKLEGIYLEIRKKAKSKNLVLDIKIDKNQKEDIGVVVLTPQMENLDLQASNIDIDDTDFKHRRLGRSIYIAVNDALGFYGQGVITSKGFFLESKGISPGKNLWESLVRDGYAEKILGAGYRMLSSSKSPDGVAPSSSFGNNTPEGKKLGGIDFNAKNMNVTATGSSSVDFTLPEGITAEGLMNAQGFVPVIISITPVANIWTLMGLNREDAQELQRVQGLGEAMEPEKISLAR